MRLYFQVRRKGPPLAVLHGFSSSSSGITFQHLFDQRSWFEGLGGEAELHDPGSDLFGSGDFERELQ